MSVLLDQKELTQLNQIIADLYTESDPEKAFQLFLERLKDLVCFEKGDVYFYKEDNHNMVFEDFIFVDWGSRDLTSYLDRYCIIDDVLPIVAGKQPLMFRCSDIFITSEREKTEYYRELLSPAGMQHSIEGNVYTNDDGYVGGIGIHRSDAMEDFSLKDLEILKLTRPHLANISKKFRLAREGKNHYLDILPLLSSVKDMGICIWNFDLNLVDTNIESNHFVPAEHKQQLMRSLITLCKSLRENILRNEIKEGNAINRSKSRISIGGKSYFAEVTFVPVDKSSKGRFVAMIYDYEGIIENIISELKDNFSLTSREFEVLQCMIRGMSNHEIAEHLFITVPTVKKHLTSIYQKLKIEGKHQILSTIL